MRKAPDYADAWAMLALLCLQDYAQGFNLQTDSLASGSTAARRAVEAAPSNHLAYVGLAQALFFQKEFQGFRNAAERAVALNSMDGNSIAFLGELLTYSGDRSAASRWPDAPSSSIPIIPDGTGMPTTTTPTAGETTVARWISRSRSICRATGTCTRRSPPPTDSSASVMRPAKPCGICSEVRPNFAATVRKDVEKWWDPEYGERLIDGLRKAGLEIC